MKGILIAAIGGALAIILANKFSKPATTVTATRPPVIGPVMLAPVNGFCPQLDVCGPNQSIGPVSWDVNFNPTACSCMDIAVPGTGQPTGSNFHGVSLPFVFA